MSVRPCATRVRTSPLNFLASSRGPAAKNTASPGPTPHATRIASARSGSRFFAIGPFAPSASNVM